MRQTHEPDSLPNVQSESDDPAPRIVRPTRKDLRAIRHLNKLTDIRFPNPLPNTGLTAI